MQFLIKKLEGQENKPQQVILVLHTAEHGNV